MREGIRAYLLEGLTVVFSADEIEDIINFLYNDWFKFGCRGTLELPTVETGIFEGYIDEYTNCPVGIFTTDKGKILRVGEDNNAEVVRQSIYA